MTDRYDIDRGALRAACDRASGTYDEAAVLQARVRDELIERLALVNLEPRVVLDLGSATGSAARELGRRFDGALVIACDLSAGMSRRAAAHTAALCGDAARLPLPAASVDLVYSNLMLHWWPDPHDVFAEARRVLRVGGFFAFSTFGPDTLQELRAAWAAADDFTHVNRFVDMHDIGDALVRAGFSEPVMDVERVCLTYPDVFAVMRDLKALGAQNATAGRARGLTGRARLARMSAAYEPWRRDGRLPVTCEIVYGAAWRGEEAIGASVIGGEARVPIEAIRRRPT